MATLDDYKSDAKLYMESGDYGAAIRALTEAITLETDNPTLYFSRGLAYFMRKDYDLAIEDLTAVLASEHQNLDALLTRGNAFFHTNQLSEAYHDYSEFINLAPDNPNAPYERRAVILTRQNNIEGAIEQYKRAIDHTSEATGKLHYNVALLHYARGQFEMVLDSIAQAIANDYPAPEAYELRGSAYAQLQQLDEALVDYDKAIELDKRSASAHYNRGAVRYQSGDFTQAISDFSTSLKIDDTDLNTRYARASAYLDAGEYRNARRDLSRILRENPNYASAYHKRGIAYAMRDQIDKALDDFEKAVELSPTSVDYLVSLGEIELEVEDYDYAIGSFKRALLHHSDNTQVNYHNAVAGLAVAYFGNGDNQQASNYYNQLVGLDLDYGDVEVWQKRFGWHHTLLEVTSEMINWVEAQVD